MMEKIPVTMPTIARSAASVDAISADIAKLQTPNRSTEPSPVAGINVKTGIPSAGHQRTAEDAHARTSFSVPKPSSVVIIASIAALGLYTYATIKDGGVVVNEQTGERRSVYRWVDIGLGIVAALYILSAIRTM